MNELESDGGPAFPQPATDDGHACNTPYQMAGGGMSMRDYFAAAALQGILSGTMTRVEIHKSVHVKSASLPASVIEPSEGVAASLAYRYADAMLAARSKS